MGDPRGIGPEVTVKSLAAVEDPSVRFRVFGIEDALEAAAARAGLLKWNRAVESIESLGFSTESVRTEASAGEASFRWVEAATRAALPSQAHSQRASALVTAPIAKSAWAAAGHAEFPGHTELLARLCGTLRGTYGMMFHVAPTATAPGINAILTTVHVPISKVPSLITRDRVLATIRMAHTGMQDLGVESPKLAVCGLNPHAGEDGLIGTEEVRHIAPAIAEAQDEGIAAYGPFPGDTIFRSALSTVERRAQFDCVVAMFHDQGLTAIKTLAMERAVNRTVGLPIIRTSPDHGTALALAGKNLADPGSMAQAVALAVTLARRSGLGATGEHQREAQSPP